MKSGGLVHYFSWGRNWLSEGMGYCLRRPSMIIDRGAPKAVRVKLVVACVTRPIVYFLAHDPKRRVC